MNRSVLIRRIISKIHSNSFLKFCSNSFPTNSRESQNFSILLCWTAQNCYSNSISYYMARGFFSPWRAALKRVKKEFSGCKHVLCEMHWKTNKCSSDYGTRMLSELRANIVDLEWEWSDQQLKLLSIITLHWLCLRSETIYAFLLWYHSSKRA